MGPVADDVQRARAGDGSAFQRLYEAHIDATYGYCLAFCRGDQAGAADLCQEAFEIAFRRLGELDEPAAFPGWLRTVTRRVCLRAAGRQRLAARVAEASAREPSSEAPFPERMVALVPGLIATCPDDALRATAQLFYGDPPASTAEIGARLGVSQTAVTTRLSRFRAWARVHLLARLLDAAGSP